MRQQSPSWGSHVRWLGALMVVALLGLSCAPAPTGRDGASVDGPPAAPKTLRMGVQAQNEPSAGTDGVMSVASFGGAGNGSPALEHYFLFHNNLTVFDVSSAIIPRLAQKIPSIDEGDWKVLPNGTMEVTWKIRPDARWHDGTPLTAADFVFGLEVFRDPAVPHAPRGELASISEVRAADPQTLLAVWKTHSILGNSSANDGIPVLPKHIFEDLYRAGNQTAFENTPFWNTQWVGLGPYKLTRWELGSYIEGTAFDQYLLGRPKIDRVVLQYIGDVNALIANVLSGDIDLIPLGAQLDVPQMVSVRQTWQGTDGGLTMAVPKGVRTIYLQLKDPSAPWAQDVRLRQALIYALDRDTFVETLLSGVTNRADFFLHPDEQPYKLAEQRGLNRFLFDPRRSEQLLTEAGYMRGADRLWRSAAGQPIHIDVTASGQGANVQEAQTVASNWATAGFQSGPTPYPAAADNASEIRHKAPGALIWPYNFSQTVIKTFTPPEIGTDANRYRGGNYGGYLNRDYERMYDQLINTFDVNQRNETTFNLLKILNDELPALPIFFTPLCVVARKGLEGPGMTSAMQAGNAWNIHTWTMK